MSGSECERRRVRSRIFGRPLAVGVLWVLVVVLGLAVSIGRAGDSNHFVRLFDGSALHGNMASLDPKNGLLWQHPDAAEVLRFPFPSIASIRFNPTQHWKGGRQSQCRFRFTNGDEVYGKILGMNDSYIGMETWFGGSLRADRSKVQSIAFLQNGYRVLYEGPNTLNEWVLGKSPNGWGYQDGVLSVKDRGVIGRDMGLEDSASLAFDLSWERTFQLTVTMHAETLDRYDYSKGAYVFSLSPQFVSFQRIQPGAGVMTLGQIRLTNLVNRTKARFDLRSHREKSAFALLADGEVIGTWKDSRGFVSKGSGVSFSSHFSRSTFSLSRILVTEWDGLFESDFEVSQDQSSDGLLLINRDQPMGKVKGISEGKLNFHLRNRVDVQIPLERIKQIQLHQSKRAEETHADDEIRVLISGGGSLSFELARWTDTEIEGISQMFGPVQFAPGSVRQVELNLERHRLEQWVAQEEPEDVWDFEADE
ncbi:MAG: hypothetical protein M2R45_03595 [Verrucomicrobia subdivision 3 bacterium]|nr:hypothetical protein [Limisphaerales bacterium]MCS1414773.1 hypothetical protein [Limisphaerales bacterium]